MPRPITKAQRAVLNTISVLGPFSLDTKATNTSSLIKRGMIQKLVNESDLFIISFKGWKEVQS